MINMEDKANKVKLEVHLRNQQRELNKRYVEEGLTDEILDKQVELNRLRHEHDIADESKRVYENFVQ